VITFNGEEVLVRERAGPAGVEYAFSITPPGSSEPVEIIARIDVSGEGLRPKVFVKNARDCRRHRWPDHSLCMWYDPDDSERKWTVGDGLEQLAGHVGVHLFNEAVCRAGDAWPGDESPGEHPRPNSCTTCGGEGD